jgi:hypothetical protein
VIEFGIELGRFGRAAEALWLAAERPSVGQTEEGGQVRVEFDSLLGKQEPTGSFHDALLISVEVDYAMSSLVAEFSILVGDPVAADEAARERRRRGRLRLSGLLHWSLEPSAAAASPKGPLWLTSDGRLDQAPTEVGLAISTALPADCIAWYLYFSDIDAFAYVAAKSAEFEWL